LEDVENLVVPTISIYEVYKKVLRERGSDDAMRAATLMLAAGHVVDLDGALALEAARYWIPLADSIIYATAARHGAMLWTQDEDFKHLPSVRYFEKQASR
jgi:predicted nucleic acid-binding protein